MLLPPALELQSHNRARPTDLFARMSVPQGEQHMTVDSDPRPGTAIAFVTGTSICAKVSAVIANGRLDFEASSRLGEQHSKFLERFRCEICLVVGLWHGERYD